MKKILALGLTAWFMHPAFSQDAFTITRYDVTVTVNKDASLDVKEDIAVHFNEPRHGIFREIPIKYRIVNQPAGTEQADRQFSSGGYSRIFLENIKVSGWNYSVSDDNGYKQIKFGDKNKLVEGDQEYQFSYRLLNTINFFKDHSEFYFNIIGDKWETTIDKVNFTIDLYNALPQSPDYFIASGSEGSTGNGTQAAWSGNKTLTGTTINQLNPYEGVTVGIKFPQGFLVKQNYQMRGILWLIFPGVVFLIMFLVWWKWGRDEKLTIQTEFYPPPGTSPSVAGYVIDDQLDRRDLTALVPYWGAGGYLTVKETAKDEFQFTKVKDLPDSAMSFEKTFFNGLFSTGNTVMLNDLKYKLYNTMNSAKSQLEAEVTKGAYYEKGSRGMGCLFNLLGLGAIGFGVWHAIKTWGDQPIWMSLAFVLSGIIMIVFGIYMPKKTQKGNLLYQKLAGFKEFIKLVEKPKLQQFLKDDPQYIDTVLPFAIVFDVAHQWKDKLKDMDIPPPTWYSGGYGTFSTYMFLNSLDHSMNQMSSSFFSAPPSSGGGSSGGSWGGGGFSGGGFGGGGGGSW